MELRRAVAPSVLTALLAAGLALPATGTAAGTCKRLVDVGPTGADPADAVQIRISGTSCSTAYKVIRSAIRSYDPPGTKLYAGYTCNQRFSSRTTCKKGAKRVSFRLG